MNAIWGIGSFALAGASAHIIYRRVFRSLRFPLNALIGLILFVVLYLLPVHLLAALELLGLLKAVTTLRIAATGGVILSGVLIVASQTRHAPLPVRPRFPTLCSSFKRLPLFFQAAITLVAAVWLICALNLFTSYPSGWDTLSYHLPVVVRWLQQRSLRIPPSGAWEFSLPGNAEIGMMLLLSTSVQSFISLINVLACIIASCAIYEITRLMSEEELPSLLTVLLFFSLPIIQFQVFTGYVDLYGASFMLAGIAIFLQRLKPPPHLPLRTWYAFCVVLSGLAYGIAIGTKPTYNIYAAACGGMTILVTRIEKKRHRRAVSVMALLLLFGMLIPSAWWFFRAFQATGNPIYPLKVTLCGKTLLKGFQTEEITSIAFARGYVRSERDWLFYPWLEYTAKGRSYRSGVSLGAFWATFVPLGIIYGLILIFKTRQDRTAPLYRIFMGSLFLMGIVWWHVFRKMPRFGIPLLAIACILTFPLFECLLKRHPNIFWGLVLCSVMVTSFVNVVDPASQLLGRIRSGRWDRASVYEYPPILDSLPQGTVVWNINPTAAVTNFPLAGKRLSNIVIPSNWKGAQSLADFIRQEHIRYIAERTPCCLEELEKIGARKMFEGKVGSWFYWRVWEIPSPEHLD